MINKRKFIVGASVLLLVLYIIFPWCKKSAVHVASVWDNNFIMGIPVVSETEILQKTVGLAERDFVEGVLFKYTEVPLDVEEQTIYISQNVNSEFWEGNFTLTSDLKKQGYQLYLAEDADFFQKKEAIKNGHTFKMYVVGEDYSVLNVVFSGLGVMNIRYQEELEMEESDPDTDPDAYYYESEPRYRGDIAVFYAADEGEYQIRNGYIEYHLKGDSTSSYPKKGYALKFVDAGGKKVSVPLLGMDSNAKWKLNSLYTDNTLVREKSSIDIWKAMDEYDTGTTNFSYQSEYVEVVLDGNYLGVYLLIEGVDEETFALNRKDVMYKCINWNVTDWPRIDDSVAHKWRIQFPYRIKYPEVIQDYQEVWAPVRDYVGVFFHETDKGNRTLAQRVDIDNLYDLNIFIDVCGLSDNHYKNMYLTARVQNDGSYVMSHYPWDLDLGFGHIYNHDAVATYDYDENVEKTYQMEVLSRILEENPEWKVVYYDKYCEYRENVLSNEKIETAMVSNWKKVKESGALGRNQTLWMVEGKDSDIEDVTGWAKAHLEWLDVKYKSFLGK